MNIYSEFLTVLLQFNAQNGPVINLSLILLFHMSVPVIKACSRCLNIRSLSASSA